jgi:large subunit ribosomal protein L13
LTLTVGTGYRGVLLCDRPLACREVRLSLVREHDGRATPDRSTRQGKPVRTYSPKPGEIERQWHVIDASDVVLGRLATHAATLLRGKHKPTFAPHVDTGDFVVVVNAGKVALTGNKRQTKVAYRHSGYPGGLKQVGYEELLDKHPERAIELAVKGMLPHNKLGRKLIRKLKVYPGAEHPHAAQQPKPFEIKQIAQ